MPGLLEDLRVLDLTDERSRLAGRAFADLGADVVACRTPRHAAGTYAGASSGPGSRSVAALDDGLWLEPTWSSPTSGQDGGAPRPSG